MLRLAVALFVLSMAASARADLMADAELLIQGWSRQTATAARLTTVFLHDGESRDVRYPDDRTPARRCLSIAAVAERHVRFTLAGAGSVEPLASRAGVAVLTDCGGGVLTVAPSARRVELEIAQGRGAIEVIVATHAGALPPPEVWLAERAVGPVGADDASPGALPLAPQSARVARARRSAVVDGATTIVPLTLAASETGVGATVLSIGAGCHRIHVIADAREGDLDADARRHDSGLLLQRDRSHAPDARLAFCLGETERVEIRFVGAPAKAKVTLVHASWGVPAGVPATWGPEVQAGLSWALFRRRVPQPSAAPVFQWLGAAGSTVLPIAVEPGACYLAAVAIARGTASAGRLTAVLGHRQVFDDASDAVRSAGITFCAGPTDDRALLVVDVRSRDAWWVASLWRVGVTGG